MSRRKPTVKTYYGAMVKIKLSQNLGQIIGLEIRGRNTRYIVRTIENDSMVEAQFAPCEFDFVTVKERSIGFNEV